MQFKLKHKTKHQTWSSWIKLSYISWNNLYLTKSQDHKEKLTNLNLHKALWITRKSFKKLEWSLKISLCVKLVLWICTMSFSQKSPLGMYVWMYVKLTIRNPKIKIINANLIALWGYLLHLLKHVGHSLLHLFKLAKSFLHFIKSGQFLLHLAKEAFSCATSSSVDWLDRIWRSVIALLLLWPLGLGPNPTPRIWPLRSLPITLANTLFGAHAILPLVSDDCNWFEGSTNNFFILSWYMNSMNNF